MKKQSLPRRVLLMGASAVFTLFPENHMLSVSEYQVRSEKIPQAFDGYRICQLSDLHSKSYGKGNRRLLRKIDESHPNLLVLTGDMVTRTDTDHHVFLSLAEKLAEKYKVYYVVGNHEQEMGRSDLNAYLAQIRKLGIRVLDNEKTELERGGDHVCLYGMWFPLKYYKESKQITRHEEFGRRQMQKTMGACDPAHYGILLTHDPLRFPVYAGWGADLTLCGHVHGGMIRLPFGVGLLSPERRFFPRYSGGVYETNGKKMIVSRGLGSGTFGARIHNVPEIVNITLRTAQADG